MGGEARKVVPHDQIPPQDPPLRPIPAEFGTSVQELTDRTYESSARPGAADRRDVSEVLSGGAGHDHGDPPGRHDLRVRW